MSVDYYCRGTVLHVKFTCKTVSRTTIRLKFVTVNYYSRHTILRTCSPSMRVKSDVRSNWCRTNLTGSVSYRVWGDGKKSQTEISKCSIFTPKISDDLFCHRPCFPDFHFLFQIFGIFRPRPTAWNIIIYMTLSSWEKPLLILRK